MYSLSDNQGLCSSALGRDWPWDSCWNMANYVLKTFKASSPRKEHNISPEVRTIFTFLCEAGELDFLGISAFLYLFFCASGSDRILKREVMKMYSSLGKMMLFAACHPGVLGEKRNCYQPWSCVVGRLQCP